ncbi:MAG: glycosyltransferase, partial [Candidatus Bathyarchaeota archaeon]|nr:glycosyltransferase [Candidatus Termiticorpusculum sp.]
FEMIIEVAKQIPNTKFIIAGRGGGTNNPYYNKLTTLKPNNVELYTDTPRNEITNLLGKAKIYLHCMIGEHFGISIGEAMAAGCIPVIHTHGGPIEIAGEHGFTFNDLKSCVEAVKKALECETDINAIVKRAETFSDDAFKKRFMDVLEKNDYL